MFLACLFLSSKDVVAAAQDIELDLVGVQEKEEELRRFLAVASEQEAKGEVAVWYWKEDEGRMNYHADSSRYGNCCKGHLLPVRKPLNSMKFMTNQNTLLPFVLTGVRYADSVAAQMEFYWLKKVELRNDTTNDGRAIVEVDVNGRVTSSSNRGKAVASETGTVYRVDLDEMVQINARSGFKREVQRLVEKRVGVGSDTKDALNSKDSYTKMSLNDTDDQQQAADDDIPAFPQDLVDEKTGELKEPLLRARKGQLIQIQSKRSDGWACTYCLFKADS